MSKKAKEERRQSKRPRKGVWSEIKTFQHEQSGMAVIVSERIRGKPEYSVQFVHFDKHGGNKYLPVYLEGDHGLPDVVYSLAKAASEFIEQRRTKESA